MSDLVLKNFEMTRSLFLKKLEGISQESSLIYPEGFNNHILWNIGHVLTSTEQFMFGFPHKTANLPAHYVELFGMGTKPADWQDDVPTLQVLIEQLKDQVTRLKEIPTEKLNEHLTKPFLGIETYGELANFALFHEAHHLGQIHLMKRLVEKN
ncbi:DinB family protein [Bacillus sp. CGMCC 1.16607]|uniref:DinB family protein n=1 Tax=Bacillus sp. CGMCC 1.16607 TaxID=3351842 RepID=UPI0036268EA4